MYQGNRNKLRITVQELTSNYFTEVRLRKKLNELKSIRLGNSRCFYFKLHYNVTKESITIFSWLL